MAKYELIQKAIKDLGKIWNYTVDTWSENQADKYFHMILDSCQEIADGKVKGKQYEGIYPGLQGNKTGKHIIFYRQMDKDRVEIARILHERIDLNMRIRK